MAVLIPFANLSDLAQRGVLEEFVMREGTDYGAAEATFERKIGDVRRQIERGEVKLVFDPESESVTLLTERQWRDML